MMYLLFVDGVNEPLMISKLLTKLIQLQIVLLGELGDLDGGVDGPGDYGVALVQDFQASDGARVD